MSAIPFFSQGLSLIQVSASCHTLEKNFTYEEGSIEKIINQNLNQNNREFKN